MNVQGAGTYTIQYTQTSTSVKDAGTYTTQYTLTYTVHTDLNECTLHSTH